MNRLLLFAAVVGVMLLTACQGTQPVRGDDPKEKLPYRAMIEITPDVVRPPDGISRIGIDCNPGSIVIVTVEIGEGRRGNAVQGAAYCGSQRVVENVQMDLGFGYMISNSNSGFQTEGEAGCFHGLLMAPATPSNWKVTCTFY